jgi:hypothetical protein
MVILLERLAINWYIEVFSYGKKTNNEDFAINSFQDNEIFKAPVTLTFDLVITKSIGVIS